MAKTNYSPTFPMFPGSAVTITPSDTVNLTSPAVIYVGGAGNVRVLTAQNNDVIFVGMQPGAVVPVQVLRVFSTNTTATSMLGVY